MLHSRAALVCGLSSRKRREVFGWNRCRARQLRVATVDAYIPRRLALQQEKRALVALQRYYVGNTRNVPARSPHTSHRHLQRHTTCKSVSMALKGVDMAAGTS